MKNFSRVRRAVVKIVLVLCLLLWSPSVALAQSEAEARWQALDAAGLEAFHDSRMQDSAAYYKQAFDLAEQIYGHLDQRTIDSLGAFAYSQRALGQMEEAILLYEDVYKRVFAKHGHHHDQTLLRLNNLADTYHKVGRLQDARAAYAAALEIAPQVVGDEDPVIFVLQENLSYVLMHLNDLDGAQDLLGRAIAGRRAHFGPAHELTIKSLFGLAVLKYDRFGEAEGEPLYLETLDLARGALGEQHPRILGAEFQLAVFYNIDGRYGEAEELLERVLAGLRMQYGDAHPALLEVYHQLVALKLLRDKPEEALAMARAAHRIAVSSFGENSPQALLAASKLAGLEDDPRRKVAANRALFEYRTRTFGPANFETLVAATDYAQALAVIGQVEAAEAILLPALRAIEEGFGPDRWETFNARTLLANWYALKRNPSAASEVLLQNIADGEKILGPQNLDLLLQRLLAVTALSAANEVDAAVEQAEHLLNGLLGYFGAELYATQNTHAGRSMAGRLGDLPDILVSLAVAYPENTRARDLAATGILRAKDFIAAEEAAISRALRQSEDPQVAQLAEKVTNQRRQLSAAYQTGVQADEIQERIDALDRVERELARISRSYRSHLATASATVGDLQAALGPQDVLVEFVTYEPDFNAEWRTAPFSEVPERAPHWAAVVFSSQEVPRIVPLGPLPDLADHTELVLQGAKGADEAARALFTALIEPLDLDPEMRVTVAPTGPMHLLPFHRLVQPDGRFWVQTTDLRFVPSGRDFLSPPNPERASGLLAVGGLDFGAAPAAPAQDARFDLVAGERDAREDERMRSGAASVLRNGFAPLPSTAFEVAVISGLYAAARPVEAVDVWSEDAVTEDTLLSIPEAPRVLHLATHGFYRAAATSGERPLLLSGIALSGANDALRAPGSDGLLSALEAQSLSLVGTELVVLSACETGQGALRYGDGLYGLVRALRTAGSENVLVALRPVDDESTATFMRTFYSNWLSQEAGTSDLAKALRDTQTYFIDNAPDFDWAPYVLVGPG